MKEADEIQQVRTDVWFWQAYDSSVKTDLSCCAVATLHGLVFVDPIPLASEPLVELTQSHAPAAIILTNANHERAASKFREEFGVPIFAHRAAQPELCMTPDHFIEESAILLDTFTPAYLPGFAAGEIALHQAANGGAFFIGDSLINVPSHGFVSLPAKYCSDAKLARHSLEKLLQFDFELMTFAHGFPIVTGAKSRLASLLA